MSDSRSRLGLRPLTNFESGERLKNLPGGVFGFGSLGRAVRAVLGPVLTNQPTTLTVEYQKEADGTVFILVWLTEETLTALGRYLTNPEGSFEFVCFDTRWEQANVQFRLPLYHIDDVDTSYPGSGVMVRARVTLKRR